LKVESWNLSCRCACGWVGKEVGLKVGMIEGEVVDLKVGGRGRLGCE